MSRSSPRPRRHPEANPRTEAGLHPRNRHQGHYDLDRLTAACTGLVEFVRPNAHGQMSIDFGNPAAVKALNKALLVDHYGIQDWDLPPDALCPSVPGRADYLHTLADLLAQCNHGVIPTTRHLRGLDIGTGAGCIYPLIGHGEYGWSFVASDIHAGSLAHAQEILDANPPLASKILLRIQPSPGAFFKDIVLDDDWFDFTLCNPPFHASAAEVAEASRRKWRNLGHSDHRNLGNLGNLGNLSNLGESHLNFGGRDHELWCPGGELAFIGNMIAESRQFATRCFWFTSLVSKSSSLPGIYDALKRAHVKTHHTLTMSQGQKQSRCVAWTFLTPSQQDAWRKLRW